MRNRSRLPMLVAAVIMLAACGADPDGPGVAPPTTPERSPVSPPATSEDQPDQPSVPASLDFTATTVDGATFDAAELAGEPVVFWFWAPWCPRCVASAPDVLALAEDVTVVGVGGLAPDSDMRGFVDRTGMGGLTHLSDPDGAVWGMFGVTAQETMVVIDADGEVVHNGIVSPAALRERLNELI